MAEPVRVEVAPQLLVEHTEDIAVEVRRHAGGVVVGRDEPFAVLDEIGPDEQGVVARHGAVQVEEEASPLGRVQVADRPAQERDHPPALGRDLAEVLVKVADDHMDVERVELLGQSWRRRRGGTRR